MRPLIFLFMAVLILGMTALATAGDCPGGFCPLAKNTTMALSMNTLGVLGVMAVGIVDERQPVRSIIEKVEANKPIRSAAKRLVARNRDRALIKRVLKFPQRLRRRVH